MALLLVAVNAPVLAATTRALTRGWQPLGDNGILLVRARDVGTEHHPLLGSWTSASLLFERPLNNPGPLYADLVAVPVKLLGPWVGGAVGVMLLNMAASTLAVVATRRISGVESMVAVAAAVVGLQFAMGSELLFDLWQPNALVLPMMAFLVVAVALAAGDLAMAPWCAALATLLVQTHLSHAPVVAAVTVVCVVLATVSWRGRGAGPSWRRPLAWTGLVLAACWAQPVVDEITGGGQGNLSGIAGAVGGESGPARVVGLGRALRIMAEITVVDPWFTRSTYDHAVPQSAPDAAIVGLTAPVPTVLALTLTFSFLIGLVVIGIRAGERGLAAMAGTSAVALVAGIVAAGTSPINVTGIAVHGMRWLWPIAALVTAVALTGALVLARSRPAWGRRATNAGIALVVAAALANLPTHASRSWGPTLFAPDLPAAQQLVAGLDALEGRGTVLFDTGGLRYGEPFSGLVLAELQDRGIPFEFDDEVMIRQLGEGRRRGRQAAIRLWQVEGDAATNPPPGAERIAFADAPLGPVALLVEPIAARPGAPATD